MQTNVIVHNVKFRGYTFSMVPWSSLKNFFSLKSFWRLEVDTNTSKTSYAFRHGAKMWWTYNQPRVFTLNFELIATDELERYKWIKLVNAIFGPPSNPSIYNTWYYPIEFTTPDGVVWTTQVKVTSRPRAFDYDNSKRIWFEVKLTSKENSFIYSKQEYSILDTNTKIGNNLPNNLPTHAGYNNEIIDYSWVSDSPVNVKITARQYLNLPFIFVRSIVDWELKTTLDLKNIELNEWDYIFVNSYDMTITKTSGGIDTDITSLAELNSEFPYIASPINWWDVCMAVDCGIIEPVLDITYSYQDLWE